MKSASCASSGKSPRRLSAVALEAWHRCRAAVMPARRPKTHRSSLTSSVVQAKCTASSAEELTKPPCTLQPRDRPKNLAMPPRCCALSLAPVATGDGPVVGRPQVASHGLVSAGSESSLLPIGNVAVGFGWAVAGAEAKVAAGSVASSAAVTTAPAASSIAPQAAPAQPASARALPAAPSSFGPAAAATPSAASGCARAGAAAQGAASPHSGPASSRRGSGPCGPPAAWLPASTGSCVNSLRKKPGMKPMRGVRSAALVSPGLPVASPPPAAGAGAGAGDGVGAAQSSGPPVRSSVAREAAAVAADAAANAPVATKLPIRPISTGEAQIDRSLVARKRRSRCRSISPGIKTPAAQRQSQSAWWSSRSCAASS
mmetsp:Transcript_47002/g.130823  ORF Transcript_47002/g.130823 Transcript_47002/m.130823 type:complete len:372 (+) Transcript_47002:816-1931(+)